MTRESPLAGVRVVETGGRAVAFAGRLLADAGADVVRVVSPAGDPLAKEPPFFGQSGVSIQETWYNAGKKLVTADLAIPAGRRALLDLVAATDILLEDWGPGADLLPPGHLRGANLALVRVSVTATGRSGAALHTNDLVLNALSGAASVTGTGESGPINGWGNQAEHTTGLYTVICALAGLRARNQGGGAMHVDLSALEAAVSCTEQLLMQWWFPGTWSGKTARRQGSLHWSGGYDVFPTRDGGHVMVVGTMRTMETLIPWLVEDGADQGLADRDRYPDLISLVKDLPRVMRVLRDWAATKDAMPFFLEAQRRHLAFGTVLDVPQAARTAQIEARRWLQAVQVPGAGSQMLGGRLMATERDSGHPQPATRITIGDIQWHRRRPGDPSVGGPPPPGRPLEGVRILDFTHVLAGPFGTRVLGDLGAQVIKVGTASRAGGANSPGHPYYACWNRNKLNVTLNMANPEGREVARRLAARCDAVVENFSAGVLSRWQLDRSGMATANPGLTVVSMGGMGQSGPWKDFVTYAPTIHALCGLTALTNPPGRRDLGYGFSLTDHLSGLMGAFAVLQGVEHRRRTGEGLAIDLSQYELGLGIVAPALMDHLANGTVPGAVGNRDPYGQYAPHGLYPCAGEDRWVALAVANDQQWQSLCEALDQPAVAQDARFATHRARIEHQDALDEAVTAMTQPLDRYEVMSRCQLAGIAAGAVQDASDLTERDPALAARTFFANAAPPSERWGAHSVDTSPALFNGTRPPRYEPAHELGADTFAVLTEVLGMDDEAIAKLMATGALS